MAGIGICGMTNIRRTESNRRHENQRSEHHRIRNAELLLQEDALIVSFIFWSKRCVIMIPSGTCSTLEEHESEAESICIPGEQVFSISNCQWIRFFHSCIRFDVVGRKCNIERDPMLCGSRTNQPFQLQYLQNETIIVSFTF